MGFEHGARLSNQRWQRYLVQRLQQQHPAIGVQHHNGEHASQAIDWLITRAYS